MATQDNGKMVTVLLAAFEAAREGKQALIACGDGKSIIVAPAPHFDPSAVEPPLLIATDGKPCTCGLGQGDPCPVHQAEEAHERACAIVRDALRSRSICGHITREESGRENVCVLPLPCEVDDH
jgi:hypothetical protein